MVPVSKASATAEEAPEADAAVEHEREPSGPVGPESDEERRRREQDRRDRRLVKRLKTGDERAFQELVRTYQNRVFGLTFRMLGNRAEAEDLAQEVFLTVFRAIGSYRGEGRFYTWLYRIAANTTKNRIKYLKTRKYNQHSVVLEDSPQAQMPAGEGGSDHSLQSQIPGPEAVVRGNRLQQAIQRELAELDAEHRVLIVLRDIEGLTYQDIINITGLAEGTLKSRLHRARMALKKRMEQHMR